MSVASVLGVTALAVVCGVIAVALCEAGSSPDPATVLALYRSALRAIVWSLLARLLRLMAPPRGMWRRSAVEPGRPFCFPTWIGAWIGWHEVWVLERFADEDAVRIFLPDRRANALEEAKGCRGCLEGTLTWPDPAELREGGS